MQRVVRAGEKEGPAGQCLDLVSELSWLTMKGSAVELLYHCVFVKGERTVKKVSWRNDTTWQERKMYG